MIPVPSGVRVWLAVGHTDMRRGMNSLALQVQGYATLRLDSFTARGYHNVCDNPGQVRPGERAQDVFTAAFLLAARPDVRTDKIAVLGLSHGGGTAIYLARDHEELRPWCERLATRRDTLRKSMDMEDGGPTRAAEHHLDLTPLAV